MRQLSFRLDGLCDVCRYPLTAGACGNPVCGGTDAAAERFAQAARLRDAQGTRDAERQRLMDLSFGRTR